MLVEGLRWDFRISVVKEDSRKEKEAFVAMLWNEKKAAVM